MLTNLTFRHKVIDIALGETYVRSKKHPDQIKKYLKAVDISWETNWCVAFVYWCYQKASSELGCYNPMPKTASTGSLFRFAEQYLLFVEDPSYGDIYISKKKHHTGLVLSFDEEYSQTVEGNTWVGNHIWGVHERKEKDLSEAYFIRL